MEKAMQYCMESKIQNNDGKIIYADEKMLEKLKWKDEIRNIISPKNKATNLFKVI